MTATDQLPFDQTDDLHEELRLLIRDHGYEAVDYQLRLLQPGRIIGSAPARSTDPETSHLAAKREQDVGRFGFDSRQAKLLYAFSASDLTAQQAATRVVGAHAAISAFEGCRRRVSDLRAAGFITDSGGRRHNTGSEDESIVWTLTEAGRAALISLDETGWSRAK